MSMKAASPDMVIHELTRRWRRRLYLTFGLKSGAWSLLAVLGARFAFGSGLWQGLALWAGTWCVLLVAWYLFSKKKAAIPQQVAAHLNRVVPDLEESGAVFLKPPASLSVLERLQSRRVAQVLSGLNPASLLPGRPLRLAAAYFVGCLTVTSVAVALVPADLFNGRAEQDALSQAGYSPAVTVEDPKIESVVVTVEPPVYTGREKRLSRELNLRVEEGALVQWKITLNMKVDAFSLVFTQGDTLLFRRAGASYTCQRRIRQPGIYRLLFTTSAGGVASEYYKLEVIRDQAPTLVIAEPEQRTTIKPKAHREVGLKVQLEDDYGLSRAHIVATVSSGAGEGIKFRERTLVFDPPKLSGRTADLYRTLDLDRLGMAPGDELYFFVEAWDNREPIANRSRSETFFVILEDTSQAPPLASFGLGVNPLPEYFRSQRQIIIDTEKLLKEREGISAAEFKRRSNNLGIDQKALRLRYGQFLGEEAEGFDIQSAAHQTSGSAAPEAPFLSAALGMDSPEQGARNPNEAEEVIPSEFIHDHDYEENATLFSESIKTQLKAALAEMWDAELNLRTYKTKDALPFEYRALVLLKRVQQYARIYVKRIGFEPPPLQPEEKRLSGDLKEIDSQTAVKDLKPGASFSEIRAGLQVIRSLMNMNGRTLAIPEALEKLEQAGDEMAQRAVTQPGRFLQSLNELRTLISTLDGSQDVCWNCLRTVEEAFWSMLPTPRPLPGLRPAADSKLFRTYSRKLEKAF